MRLRLQWRDCESSAATMRQTIEEAIDGKAPEAAAVEIEGLPDSPGGRRPRARPVADVVKSDNESNRRIEPWRI